MIQDSLPADARCAQCGKELPPLALREGDAFCSASCAKAADGVREKVEDENTVRGVETT